MRAVQIKFSAAVFTHFFEQHERIFGIDKGLPEGSKLIELTFDPEDGEEGGTGTATFTHETFDELLEGQEIPTFPAIEYTAYAFQKEIASDETEMAEH